MQHEFSDQIDSREGVEASPQRPLAIPPMPMQPQPLFARPIPPQPLPMAMPARPGCVVAAVAVLFFISTTASCRFMAALGEGDIFSGFANFALSVLLIITALGLFRMFRWAANLVLIYTGVWSAEFLGTQLISLSIINRYMTHPVSKLMVYGVMAVLCGVVLIFPAIVFWWFWRRRRNFYSNPIVESWGRAVYVLAAVIMIAGAAATLIEANNTLPEQLEPQLRQLRQMDSQMHDSW